MYDLTQVDAGGYALTNTHAVQCNAIAKGKYDHTIIMFIVIACRIIMYYVLYSNTHPTNIQHHVILPLPDDHDNSTNIQYHNDDARNTLLDAVYHRKWKTAIRHPSSSFAPADTPGQALLSIYQ